MYGFFDRMLEKHQTFIVQQKMFFVATAPAIDGRVNVSPKGLDSFRILDMNTVAYLDLTGSGNETAAHLAESGRITFMFCSFDKQPLILRLYGRGESITRTNSRWGEFIQHFELIPGARQIIVAAVSSVQTSCGFGVPLFSFESARSTLHDYTAKKSQEALEEYWRDKNSTSIDGLAAPTLI